MKKSFFALVVLIALGIAGAAVGLASGFIVVGNPISTSGGINTLN